MNRTLAASEIRMSLDLLQKQIDLVKPKVIVALGNAACRAFSILFTFPLKIDGQFHEIKGISLVGCPHPSPLNQKATFLATQEKVFRRLKTHLP